MKKFFAEAFGCFVLVLFGCGCLIAFNIIDKGANFNISVVCSIIVTSLVFGGTIIAMFYAIGPISGCHINPAVSLTFWIDKKMSTRDFIGYVCSQLFGSIVAAFCLFFLFPSKLKLGANVYGELNMIDISMSQAIFIEIILTAIFIFTVLLVTKNDKCNKLGGIIIGLMFILVYILEIPFTRGGINPARSFGPALITGGVFLEQLWIFILSPLAGSVVASFIYKIFHYKNKKVNTKTTK